MDIYANINHNKATAMSVDVVGLQPSLADFKLLLEGRQMFVQHKLDMKIRSAGSALNRVCIARNDGADRRWFFSTFDRFVL